MTTPPTPKTDEPIKLIIEVHPNPEWFEYLGTTVHISPSMLVEGRAAYAALAAQPPAVAAPEELSDQQIIDRCNAAGVMWIAPQEETDDWGDIPGNAGFPGGFDMCSMDEMRRLLRAQPPAGQQPTYSKSEVKRLATHMGWEPKSGQQDRGEAALEQMCKERDYYHDVADDLAAQIAAITGEDIGEHSSSNNPWQNAANAATEYRATPRAPATAGEATAAQGAEPIKVSVFHLGDGDEPFVCRCSGRVTSGVLADIDKALRENEGDYFPSGAGTYEFNVTRFDGQYGFEGRCELAPGWEFENTGFEPLAAPSPAAPGNGEKS